MNEIQNTVQEKMNESKEIGMESHKEKEKADVSNQEIKPNENSMEFRQRPISSYKQGCTLYLLLTILYFAIAIGLIKGASPQWIWTLYLSPIFLVQLFLLIFMFIVIVENIDEKEPNDKNRDEECFCSVSIFLPILLLWWPVFTICYFFIYHDILSVKPELVPEGADTLLLTHSVMYEKENYTMLLFKTVNQKLGYGCITSNYEAGLTDFSPPPFLTFELPDQLLPQGFSQGLKLPTWLCTNNITLVDGKVQEKLYTSKFHQHPILQTDNSGASAELIIFHDVPFIPTLSFALFIGLDYIQAWFFTSIIIAIVVILLDTQMMQESYQKMQQLKKYTRQSYQYDYEFNNSESTSPTNLVIPRPSRSKRGFQMILSFLQSFVLLTFCMLQTIHQMNQKKITIGLIAFPGLCIIFFSLFSQIHSYFIEIIKNYWNSSLKWILDGCSSIHLYEKVCLCIYALFLPFILIFVCSVYILGWMIASLFIINMRIYLSRHFVGFWYRQTEIDLPQVKYNTFVNVVFVLDWIWKGILTPICLFIFLKTQQPSPSMVIALIISVMQFIMLPYSLYVSKSKSDYIRNDNPLWKINQTSKVAFVSEELQGMNMRVDTNKKLQFQEVKPQQNKKNASI